MVQMLYNELKKYFLIIFKDSNSRWYKGRIQIAVGETNPTHGLVQRTRERTKKRTSHVDWWLYKDASPYDEFEIIADFEEYLQNYMKERDDKK